MARNLSKNTSPREDAAKLRDLLRKAMPAVLQKLYDMALAGDVQAAKLLLDRTIPTLAPTREKPALSGVTMLERVQEVKTRVLAGEMSAEEAHDLIALVKILEDLEQAARELEDQKRRGNKNIRECLTGGGQ